MAEVVTQTCDKCGEERQISDNTIPLMDVVSVEGGVGETKQKYQFCPTCFGLLKNLFLGWIGAN